MFIDKVPVHEVVGNWLETYTGKDITEDQEESLDSLGVCDEDIFSFTFDVAKEFGFDERIDGSEIGRMACVWHVVNFVEEFI